MENVDLDRLHAIDRAAQGIERHEVAADIDHEAAPGETGFVLNADGGNGVPGGSGLYHMEKGLEAVNRAQGGWGLEDGAARRDIERVGLVLAQFLDRFARVIGNNVESDTCSDAGRKVRSTCPTRQDVQEALHGSVEPGFLVSGDMDEEMLIHRELALSHLVGGRKRHDVEFRRIRLRTG